MAETIQVDYEALNKIAASFGNSHEVTQQMRDAISVHIDQLRAGGWIGEGADAFYAEMDNLLLPAFKRLAETMRNAEYTTKEIISEMQSAEEEAEQSLNNNMSGENGSAGNGGGGSGGSGNGNGNGNSGAGSNPGNTSSGRTGQQLNQLLDSYKVESNPRYEKFRDGNPATNDTYCNLFAADVAKRLGAPLPLYVTDGNGNITKWLGATDMKRWLDGTLNAPGQYTQGPQNGWTKVSAADAVNAANNGGLVVTAGHGHMAVVRSGGNPAAGAGNVPIAQAGANNFSSGTVKNGWGQWTNEAEFYVYQR
jgi:WXG100 family type VII secretion target